MRIALVGLTHPFRGGISHYTTLLYDALDESHDVRFFSLSRQYPKLLFPGSSQIETSSICLPVPNDPCIDSMNPLSWLVACYRICKFRPDVILFSWWHPFFAPSFGTVAHLARLGRGIPSCFLCHNVVPHESSMVDRLLLRFVYSSAQHFITHTQMDREKLLEMMPAAHVSCSPHPTYEAFAAGETVTAVEAKEQLGLTAKKVLLFFGFVRPYKGLAHLLEAVTLLADDAGYHLLVVGEFYEPKDRYQHALDRLLAANQLTLVDEYVPNHLVPMYFSAADVVMVPYDEATQSGIVQLAYGFLKPVIATRVGGLPDVVFESETGYLVPPADPIAMAGAIRRLFEEDDPERMRQEISKRRDCFSWERMVETIENTCRSIR